MTNTETPWFENWFDSPYYHILYKNRDYKEAEVFITNLLDFLAPSKDAKILDLACGAGRHSIFMNKMGFDVTGVDLSKNSIETASLNKNDHLDFDTHDMREVYRSNAFDYIFSMFTSFGYFESEADNVKMLKSVGAGLKEDGTFVLDFFNANKVIKSLVSSEQKEVDGVTFDLTREFTNGYIKKNIKFSAQGNDYSYFEKVEALTLNNFESLFSLANLKIVHTFGNYKLEEFSAETSDRLIIVATKQ